MKYITTVAAAIAACALTVSADVTTNTVWGYRANDDTMVNTNAWADKWAACGGKRQSPIDIVTSPKSGKGKKVPLSFTGRCSTYNLTEPHEPLEVDVVGGNCAVSVNDVPYKMAQFHLHAPSEHTINGKSLDGEIHFVHKAADGKALLVLGIFLQVAPKSDPWVGPVLDALENVNSDDQRSAEVIVQLKSYSSLIRKSIRAGGVYNYPGSLTTPGCDETADWWVVQNPINISSIDFGRLHQDLVEYHITDKGNNARPVQPLNGRTVTRYN
ncbi:Eukaryotic-type carbonic anhydrase [Phytophthora infestans]|uniref:carbonic anhydrase n=1 Tax=Phytophthora infestans TaxID=4787 RepID=A0A8S9UDN6_PHYIN|nr:Eukaryotic-type carbonic anhydrase [Phytophthora infestans]KAF4143175.1 Eukaryotic-type carbonic anhydrase [Phytophthora infestans]